MSREEIEARKQQMRPWYWWGVPTFFRCDWNEAPEDCDIGLVGVPSGQPRIGPRMRFVMAT